jgi:hypothetical protein
MVPEGSKQHDKAADSTPSSTNGSPRIRRHTRVVAATVLLVGVSVVVGIVLSIRAQIPRRNSAARVGATLPPLPVVDSSGSVVDASKARSGRKTIIVFYSPSCDICHSELPNLQPIPVGLALIMISVSKASSEESDTSGLQCDAMFYDCDRVFERSFSMPALPTVLFVDEQGILIAALAGAHQRDVVQNKLSEFAQASPGR